MTLGTKHDEIYTFNDGANLDFVRKTPEWQESDNTFWNIEKEIEDLSKTVKDSLDKTTLLLFRLWITYPEINREVRELKQKFENNKQNMTQEFTSDFLRKIIWLLSKYVNAEENKIIKDLEGAHIQIQQTLAKRNKMKDIGWVLECFNKKMWEEIGIFNDSLGVIRWWKEPPKKEINTWTPFRYGNAT